MRTLIHSARTLSIASLISLVLAAAAPAHASGPRFAGPRGTVPPTPMHSSTKRTDGTRAAMNADATCRTVRVVHYGHPGKGVDRVETIARSCANSRMAANP